MNAAKRLVIDNVIEELCEGSKKVDSLSITIVDNRVLVGNFVQGDKKFEAKVSVNEIYDIIETNNIKTSDVKDFIIRNILQTRLTEKTIDDSKVNILNDIEKAQRILKQCK